MWHNLFEYEFMWHALVAGSLTALLSGLIGYFIVARQVAFASHALGHIGFTGACAAVLLGFSPLIGQLCVTWVAALCMAALGTRIAKNDMVISLTLGLALGFGVLLLYFYRSSASAANSILWGNLLAISNGDLVTIAAMTFVTLVIFAFIARPLWFMTVDPDLAEAKGISLLYYNLLFFSVIAIVISLTSQIAGVLLVFVLVIGPAAIALEWSQGFWKGLVFSLFFSEMVVTISLLLSYYTDWPLNFWLSALIFVGYLFSRLKNIKNSP